MNRLKFDHTRLPRPDHAEASMALAANCYSRRTAAVLALDLTYLPFLPIEAKYLRFPVTSRASWSALSCASARLPNDPLPRPQLNVGERQGAAANPASCVLLLWNAIFSLLYRNEVGLRSDIRGRPKRSNLAVGFNLEASWAAGHWFRFTVDRSGVPGTGAFLQCGTWRSLHDQR